MLKTHRDTFTGPEKCPASFLIDQSVLKRVAVFTLSHTEGLRWGRLLLPPA